MKNYIPAIVVIILVTGVFFAGLAIYKNVHRATAPVTDPPAQNEPTEQPPITPCGNDCDKGA